MGPALVSGMFENVEAKTKGAVAKAQGRPVGEKDQLRLARRHLEEAQVLFSWLEAITLEESSNV